MDSPVFYTIVTMMFASGTLSIIFFMSWKTLGKQPYALSWSIGYLAATFHCFIQLRASLFPNHETYWLTASAFSLLLIVFGIRGHCQRTQCGRSSITLWSIMGVVFAALVWTTVVEAHVGISVAIVPAGACATLLLSALMTIRHRAEPRPAEWAAAASMMIFGVSQGIAASMALMQGAGGEASQQSLYMHYSLLTLPSGYTAVGMFVIFMLASDVSFEMKALAIYDQLTGVLNRRGLSEQGAVAFATSRRNGFPVSVVMMDIDRFKDFNDEHGHAAGDAALVHFSGLLDTARRTHDFVARVGGEEFALILPGTGPRSAMKIADALCTNVESSPLQVDGNSLGMTASFGVATISDKDSRLSDTISRADRALYRSKHAGRNRVDLESSQLMMAIDGSLKPLSA